MAARRRRQPIAEPGPEPPSGFEIDRRHNEPPEMIEERASLTMDSEAWSAWMERVFEQPKHRKADLLGAFGRFAAGYELRAPITAGAEPTGIEKWSDDIAGRAGDLRDKLADLIKQAENLHGIEKAPILRAQRAVDGYKNGFIDEVNRAIETIKARLTVYLRWKAAKVQAATAEDAATLRQRAQEIADRAAGSLSSDALDQASEAYAQAEAQEAAAAAPIQDLVRTRGAEGAVVTLRGNWKFYPEESNLADLVRAITECKAPLDYVTFNLTRINFAVRSEKVHGAPGLSIRQEHKA